MSVTISPVKLYQEKCPRIRRSTENMKNPRVISMGKRKRSVSTHQSLILKERTLNPSERIMTARIIGNMRRERTCNVSTMLDGLTPSKNVDIGQLEIKPV